MHRINWRDLPANELKLPGAERATVRLLVGGDVAPNFVMLMIELEPGGHTPGHHHEWEEEIFVLAGPGKLEIRDAIPAEEVSPSSAMVAVMHS